MVKHTQTISRQFADELFECVCPFVKLALKGLLFYVRLRLCTYVYLRNAHP